ncbi:MAG: hypothetical protein IKD91_01665 [Clostridiales bacterium]|nr:hypothetical protein [Clostridiales bacterium]
MENELTVKEVMPGSIVLLLREDRVLFAGDAVNHHLWLQLDGCSPLPECV